MLPPVRNGHTVISGSRTVFQSVANYACDNGYNLVGVQSRTCESNAVWSGEEPECKGMVAIIRLLLSNQLGLFLTT
jgi:hypothetical protein